MATESNKKPTLIHNTEKEIWLIWEKYKSLKKNPLMILSLSSWTVAGEWHSRGFIYSFRGVLSHWLRRREHPSKETHFTSVLLLVNCNWWLIAYEVFSFSRDLSVLVTWSFPAKGCNRAHLGRKYFSFTDTKHFPGILKCLSFVIWSELLYGGSIWKGEGSTFRPTFSNRKSATFLAVAITISTWIAVARVSEGLRFSLLLYE